MKSLALLSLLLLIPALAFAQSKITLNFDEKSFEAGKIAELKGTVDPSLAGKPVAVEVKDSQGQVIILRTVQPDADGNFVLKFKVPTTISGGELQVSSSIESEGETISESAKIEVPTSVDAEPESITPQCGAGTVLENGICVPAKKAVAESQSDKSSGCLIATATFGTELAPQVQLLREVRENVLFSTGTGTAFMTGFNEFYYSFSPTVADLERQSPLFKEVVKTAITPMLSTLSILNHVDIDSEQEMLSYGVGVILLNVGMYFVAPAIIIFKIKNKFNNNLSR
jgi:hypothetical protein